MPIETKPLFRPDVLSTYLRTFQPPDRAEGARERLARWGEMIGSGRVDTFKEREVLPDFLSDVFCGVLGYAGPADSPAYTFSREKHIQVEGEFADAVLGRFGVDKPRFVAAVEGKSSKDPLERPYGGRRLSAVEQAYRYATNLPCDWVIVTNIRQIRLYHKGSDQRTYELFDTVRLLQHDAHLKRFIFSLGAERIVPEFGTCHLEQLRQASEHADLEITKAFYQDYADLRQDIFLYLRSANPATPLSRLIQLTQKLLDRILFVAFCEDRGLMPPGSLEHAHEHRDPYNPRPIWENFRGLFRAIDQGSEPLKIPAYNGGLFSRDAEMDALVVPDEVCRLFRRLGDYDYRQTIDVADEVISHGRAGTVDVDLLGHIFEQSITDLERLRGSLEPGEQQQTESLKKLRSRRRREGVFYTPKFITRCIVGQTLGASLREKQETLRQAHHSQAANTARASLENPEAYDLETLNKPQREALVRFWEAWQVELENVKVVDPACGSGAFLIEAFDHLLTHYQLCNARLAELRGPRLFDPDRTILEKNLYGVDLNEEAVEICRLSLWIKTAQKGKVLTTLDQNIRCGNSLIADATFDPKAFSWLSAFPGIFSEGGFDVVIGNPPYVRQELLSAIKPYLQAHYRSFHGMADLYVYFYELGLEKLLKPGGRLSLIVTNKWLRAGYAEPLRRMFAERAWMESVVDFGHAKQIFEDADVFPCIIAARRPNDSPPSEETRVCVIPREQLRIHDLTEQIRAEGFNLPRRRLGAEPWEMEPPEVAALLEKIRRRGVPLADYAGVTPYRGVVTGFNEAFLIDSATRERLMTEDPRSADILKRYLRGQDIDRWTAKWAGLWMVLARRGTDIERYPAVLRHLGQFRTQLEPKPPDWQDGEWQGRKSGLYKWYELQDPVEYWKEFAKPKILYQEIQFHPCYAFDDSGLLGNNKTFFLPVADLYLLSVLNSPLIWWHNWRFLPHMKDEALSPAGYRMENLPIAQPSDGVRERAWGLSAKAMNIATIKKHRVAELLDWLQVEHALVKPTQRLQDPVALTSDDFLGEIKKSLGKGKQLTPAAVRSLRQAYDELLSPVRECAARLPDLERQISNLINSSYGLTPEEVALIWRTAPPRMPAIRAAEGDCS